MNQKQRLLDKEAFQKQLKKKQQQAAIERNQALIKQKMAQLQDNQPSNDTQLAVAEPKKKTKYVLLALLGLVLACLPYPKVIVYEKLGIVASSIYIPSRFGSQPIILDSHYEISLDSEERWLYLCDRKNINQCNRYDVVEIKGFFAAIQKFVSGTL